MKAQTVLFEDSFETYNDFAIDNVGEWTLIDVDQSISYGFNGSAFDNSGDPFAFIVFNSTTTTPPLETSEDSDWTARTGSKAMVSFAAVMPGDGGSGPNDDWMVSPQIQLGSTGNNVSFWAKTADSNYGLERFTVGISTTGTSPEDFTIISPGTYVEPPAVTYQQYTYNLDAYAGQNVYIAIHCISPDRFGFVVDDFMVTTEDEAATDTFLASQLKVYPNPASNVVTLSGGDLQLNTVTLTDVNGRIVKNSACKGISQAELNISDLESGVYIMNVASNKGNITKKIVKN